MHELESDPLRVSKGDHVTTAHKIAYGIGGFSLGLSGVVLTAAGLYFLLVSAWFSHLGFLIACGYIFAIAIVAIALIWACLMQLLKNEALIRGVWCFMVSFVAVAAVSLAVSLTP